MGAHNHQAIHWDKWSFAFLMSVRCEECPVDGTVTDAGPEGPEDPVGSQRMFCAVAKRITAATQRHRIKRCITW